VQYAENHYLLLDSLKSKDPNRAETVFREHLESVGKVLAERYMQNLFEQQKTTEEANGR
jgi:DNA-binding FadR family transcriptional regulator